MMALITEYFPKSHWLQAPLAIWMLVFLGIVSSSAVNSATIRWDDINTKTAVLGIDGLVVSPDGGTTTMMFNVDFGDVSSTSHWTGEITGTGPVTQNALPGTDWLAPAAEAIWNVLDSDPLVKPDTTPSLIDGCTGNASCTITFISNETILEDSIFDAYAQTYLAPSLPVTHQVSSAPLGTHTSIIMGNSDSLFTVASYSQATPVPVPASVWLFGSGLLGLVDWRRRSRKSRSTWGLE